MFMEDAMKKDIKPVKVGDEIPSLTKTAYMPIDPDARNIIHTDDYAKGFGSTLLSYVLEMLYNYFGQNWLYHGKIKTSFIGGGAINGDIVTAHGLVTKVAPEETGTRVKLDVWMENQNQDKIVVGEASCRQ
jgi:hypothetical protein